MGFLVVVRAMSGICYNSRLLLVVLSFCLKVLRVSNIYMLVGSS